MFGIRIAISGFDLFIIKRKECKSLVKQICNKNNNKIIN